MWKANLTRLVTKHVSVWFGPLWLPMVGCFNVPVKESWLPVVTEWVYSQSVTFWEAFLAETPTTMSAPTVPVGAENVHWSVRCVQRSDMSLLLWPLVKSVCWDPVSCCCNWFCEMRCVICASHLIDKIGKCVQCPPWRPLDNVLYEFSLFNLGSTGMSRSCSLILVFFFLFFSFRNLINWSHTCGNKSKM